MQALKRLSDYSPPVVEIRAVRLTVTFADQVEVIGELTLAARPGVTPGPCLTLDAEDLELLEVVADGRVLAPDAYRYDGAHLEIPWPVTTLKTRVRLDPDRNTRLEGLFPCGGGYFTQCEAEGFRRITPYLDRPDVLAPFEVILSADRQRFPVLLSNGNLVAAGIEGERHWAHWVDPYPKPSYLFAIVAADLACVEDRFVTASGREVALACYVAHGLEDRCGHALDSLKAAMRWDEENYGREYDLDRYMIVAVSDFNMGAMEKQGAQHLQQPVRAGPARYGHGRGLPPHRLGGGARVFPQLDRQSHHLPRLVPAQPEGRADGVPRSVLFSADQPGGAVQRIHDVAQLKAVQFREDAGPLAHPVRPEAYLEINNFYTATVYEKGAEVVRMMANTLGKDGFRRGTDLYFERHDGQAVTVEDFVAALSDGSGQDLSAFLAWYRQAGTPHLTASGVHDPERRVYELELSQHTPPTPGEATKVPLPIPIRLALLDGAGQALPLRLAEEESATATERVLLLHEDSTRFVFQDVAERPVPSLLRGFSAPVQLADDLTLADRLLLLRHDSDPVVRWQAARQVWISAVREALNGAAEMALSPEAIAGFARVLIDPDLDPALAAELLALPAHETLLESFTRLIPVDWKYCASVCAASWRRHWKPNGWRVIRLWRGRTTPRPVPCAIAVWVS